MADSTVVGVDTPDGDSSQMKASKSDLSIAHSSPRMESSATTSTACINDIAHALRRGLSSELLCPLCDHLFDRPVMVTCGHSYCEPCIERHTRNTRSCVICKHDVGPFEAMIPSITLDNMVRKLKNEEIVESSYEESFTSEDKIPKEVILQQQQAQSDDPQQHNQLIAVKNQEPSSKLVRTMSQKRRLFFSIAAPTICSSPITPHRRRPLSPSARPTKSSLKFPPEQSQNFQNSPSSPESSAQDDTQKTSSTQNESILAGLLFRRHGFGRRSERFTSATMPSFVAEEEDSSILRGAEDVDVVEEKLKKLEENPPKMKRNSFLRRSLNAFRRSGRPGRPEKPVPEEALALISEDVEAPESIKNPESEGEKKTNNMKSLWKRLFLGSKKPENGPKNRSGKPENQAEGVLLLRHEPRDDGSFSPTTSTTSFIRLQNQHDDPQEDVLQNSGLGRHLGRFALGYYMGIGRKFERIAGGSEICLVVFGHAAAGKTTMVRAIRKLFLEGTERVRVIPLAERYRWAGIGMMPYPEGDNRLPHIVSLVINSRTEEDKEYVLDIIDPEYDNSNLPQTYMDACDAAILLIDGRNCASLLSAHQIHRNMKNAQHVNVQCELVMNTPSETSSQPSVLSSTAMLETSMVVKAGTPTREMCAAHLSRQDVEEMLISMCERVSMARRKPSPSASSVPSTPTKSTITTTTVPRVIVKSSTP